MISTPFSSSMSGGAIEVVVNRANPSAIYREASKLLYGVLVNKKLHSCHLTNLVQKYLTRSFRVLISKWHKVVPKPPQAIQNATEDNEQRDHLRRIECHFFPDQTR